jgi:beta-glucanase (GH16 family)
VPNTNEVIRVKLLKRNALRKAALAILSIGALIALIALAGCQATPAQLVAQKLVWSDEFNGPAGEAPSAKSWSYATGGSGWGNQELECYTSAPGNVSKDGAGHLVITAIKQPGHVCSDGARNDYTSARLLTQNKYATTYGRLEIRAQLPVAPGTWPAFWALGSDIDKVGWPAAGELDVMEVGGNAPSTVFGSLHGPKADNTPFIVTRPYNTGLDLSKGFHTYAANWTPSQVAFSVDGKIYSTITKADVTAAGGKWVWDHPYYLLLDLAIGGGFPGPPTAATTWPQKFVVDYVRVYQ